MERAISEMEKIRKAEEIYSKRRNGGFTYSLEDESKSKTKSLYKIMFELLFLFNIALIIVAVQNKNYIFTEKFLNDADKYSIDVKSKTDNFFNTINKVDENNNIIEKENIINEKLVDNSSEEKIENVIENIGLVDNKNETTSLSQMELDIKTIKENYSFVLPVSGVKTSGFGVREGNEIVTKYHTGVDIANNKGTIIKSAISGKVIQVSDKGDYGKHLKISIDNLVTLYAHCDKIYVKEGDEIQQGQDIAEMGSTGNSTGNHLHFEIRYENRYIDPEKILTL